MTELFCEEKRHGPPESGPLMTSNSVNVLVVELPLHGPDLCLIRFERIQVHHPVEYHRMKISPGGIARFLRRNRSLQSKLRMGEKHFFPATGRWHTEVHMLVPPRHAQRNPFVELILAKTFRRRVHHADQLVIIVAFFVSSDVGCFGLK